METRLPTQPVPLPVTTHVVQVTAAAGRVPACFPWGLKDKWKPKRSCDPGKLFLNAHGELRLQTLRI